MRLAATTARLLAVLALTLGSGTARAAITVGSADSWNLTIGGFINGFATLESGDASPHGDLYGRSTKEQIFRIRTGLLPGLLGFTFAAPEVDGIKAGARVGLYPQINGNQGARTTINGANIDLRELNFTIDGSYGQLMIGRALTLYQGKNILTDMSLFGVGVAGGNNAFDNGPTLGHIGFGYLYPSFDAQIRYTTPSIGGAKIAVAAVDPATPAGATGTVDLTTPTLEAELTYAGKSDAVSYQAFASAIYQTTKVATKDVTSSGFAGGVGVGFSGLDLLGSGFYGQGVGTTGVINSQNALDGANKARTSSGFLGQATYTLDKLKVGANYSRLTLTKTSADKATPDGGLLDSRSAITGGVWYDLIPAVKLVAEYTRAEIKFADAQKANSNTVSVGGFIFF